MPERILFCGLIAYSVVCKNEGVGLIGSMTWLQAFAPFMLIVILGIAIGLISKKK